MPKVRNFLRKSATGLFGAAAGLLLTFAALVPAAHAESGKQHQVDRGHPGDVTSTLDMTEQLALQRRALRILAMPQVQRQQKLTEDLFRKSWAATMPDGAARLELAASQFTMAAIEDALLDDPVRAPIMWVITQPGTATGIRWPGSMWGSHNPDNFSRRIMMDGASQYEISGQRSGKGPAQETFNMADSIVGTQAQSLEGAKVIAMLQDRDITYAPDGSYTITIGPDPAGPGGNHLQSVPGRNVLEIRNTLNDWWNEVPNRLRIKRVSGSFGPPRSDTEIADEAASLLSLQAPYWLKFNQERLYHNPANTTISLGQRPGGWGYISSGWFRLADDEALVITVAPMGARYMSIQISDLWSVDPDYIHRQAGLNMTQAKPNADGTFTYVVSVRDPGVWNWVDTVGLHVGGYAIRRQSLADRSLTNEMAVQSTQVVKLADLKRVLPASSPMASALDRKTQLEDRAASFRHRIVN